MGIEKTGIPWVPWDSLGNGNKISHGMGMGVKTWELSPATVTWSKGSNAGGATA